jgi:hypothetical protein
VARLSFPIKLEKVAAISVFLDQVVTGVHA